MVVAGLRKRWADAEASAGGRRWWCLGRRWWRDWKGVVAMEEGGGVRGGRGRIERKKDEWWSVEG